MSEKTGAGGQKPRVKKKKRKKTTVLAIFLAILGILIYVVFQLFFAVNATLIRTYTLDIGEVSNTIQKKGLILRQEFPFQSPANGFVSYNVQEGERIKKNGIIGKLQNQELHGDESVSLQIINRRISELSSGTVLQNPEAEIEKLNAEIEMRYSDIQNRINQREYQYIPTVKQELIGLIERKKLIEGASSIGSLTLEELQAKKQEIETRINSDKYYIKAQHSGVLSFYYDGQGDRFGFDNQMSLSVKDIKDFQDENKIEKKDQVTQDEIIGQVVNNHLWYMIMEVTQEDIQSIQRDVPLKCSILDDSVTLTLREFYKDPEGLFVGIFQGEGEDFDFTGRRLQDVSIEYKKSYGLKVNKASIIEQDGKNGLFAVNEVGQAVFKELPSVLGEDEESIIIAYLPNEIPDLKKINIYEEIILSPEGIKDGQKVR